jgi:hypothetical protein
MRIKIRLLAVIMLASTPAVAKDCRATVARDIRNYYTGLDNIPITQSSVYYHAGDKFIITGGSESPSLVCQHGGECVSIKDLRIPPSCKR